VQFSEIKTGFFSFNNIALSGQIIPQYLQPQHGFALAAIIFFSYTIFEENSPED